MKTAFFLGWCTLLVAAPAGASRSPALGDLSKVGTTRFEFSCAKKARKDFHDGVALLHSFFYEEAHRRFASVVEKDPSCSLGWWGMAMTHYHPLWAPPTAAELEEGAAEAAKGLALAKTEKDKAWLQSISAYYLGPDGKGASVPSCHGPGPDPKGRAAAWAKELEAMRTRWPKDDEVLAFHALSLLATASPDDKSRANQLRAAEGLESLFRREPDHPGAAHYLIHAYDWPELASKGLPAAKSYSKIAPFVPHVQHMPGHIFTRLGMWDESISQNLASAEAARAYAAKHHPDATSFEELHAIDYLLYAYLQQGQDKKAGELVAKVEGVTKTHPAEDMVSSFAAGSAPARWTLERRAWDEAAKLEPRGAASQKKFAFSAAMIWHARAIGAARTGDVENARQSVAKMKEITDGLTAPAQAYWKNTVEATRLGAEAWLAWAEGKKDDAIALATRSAELEEKWGKHPVSPGAVVPARELLGDMLLELGEAEKALREYEAALAEAPNRLNGLHGAARAAEKAGKRDVARRYYQKVIELTKSGDGSRRAVLDARAFLDKPS